MTRAACIMMQRDEDDLLAPWLAYHGYLFGFENLYVFDNGSSNSVTREVIRRFQRVGVNFIFSYAEHRDYEAKGHITREKINELNTQGKYDVYFPLDCDEFVVEQGAQGITCRLDAIDAHLAPAVGRRGTMVITTLLYNMPGNPSAFYYQDQQKVFFAAGQVEHLDHGNHNGGIAGGDQPRRSAITYLHFHNRSYATLRQHALMKLKNRVNTDNMDQLLAYRGHGDHLVRYFKISEHEYISSFAAKDIIMFPAFLCLLSALGADAGLLRTSFADVSGIEYSGKVFSAEFDGAAYWQANPDVAAREIPALLHYYRHGRFEHRRLKPHVAAPASPGSNPLDAPTGASTPAERVGG